MPYHPTFKEIRQVARAAVNALAEHDLESCLFGSAACAVYGMDYRDPNDVDLIVLTDMAQEDIKDLIVESDNRFYLVASTNPDATYRVLWCSLPAPRSQERRCKVDILTPGELSIPPIPPRRMVFVNPFHNIPVIPLLALLLLKLRGWTDHREDHRRHMRNKIPVDEDDIHELLDLAVEDGVELRSEKWMPRWFVREARERVAEFVEEFPDSADSWSDVGFNV